MLKKKSLLQRINRDRNCYTYYVLYKNTRYLMYSSQQLFKVHFPSPVSKLKAKVTKFTESKKNVSDTSSCYFYYTPFSSAGFSA